MILLFSVLLGCTRELTPRSVTSVDDIPSELSSSNCPEGSTLYIHGGDFQCRSPKTGKREGAHLVVTSTTKELYFYAGDTISSLPWFLKGNQEDTQKMKEFLRQDLSSVILKQFLERYPTSSQYADIFVRQREGSLSSSFKEERRTCSSQREEMVCIQEESDIFRLSFFKEQSQEKRSFFQVVSNVQVLMDKKTVSQQDVALCQKTCMCPTGVWNSFAVASAYCATQNKRLPSMGELLQFQKNNYSGTDFERTSSVPLSHIEDYSVFHEEPKRLISMGEDAIVSTVNKKGEYSIEGDNVSFRCALDVSMERQMDQYPKLLRTQPFIPKKDTKLLADSWGAKDQDYQNRLQSQHILPMQSKFGFGYKNIYMVNNEIWSYHAKNPEITAVYHLGDSNQGFPILALRVSNNPIVDEKKPAVLVNGAHHGDELMSVLFTLYNIEYTLSNRNDPQVSKWLDKLDIWFVPLVNPDGNWMTLHGNSGRNIGRKNGRETDGECKLRNIHEGVDLNRNYPYKWGKAPKGSSGQHQSDYYRGELPASEPETKVMISLANHHKFVASISWHTNGTMIISPYTIPGLKNPSMDVPWKIAEELRAKAPKQPNGRKMAVKSSMYPVDGTDQDWHYHVHGTIAYIIEGSHHNPISMKIRESSVLSINPIFVGLLDRIVQGPGFYGTVLDEAGQPLEAQITIQEQKLYENEEWTARKRDGYFYRLLPNKGTYGVNIEAHGYFSKEVNIQVTDKPFSLGTITLKPKF